MNLADRLDAWCESAESMGMESSLSVRDLRALAEDIRVEIGANRSTLEASMRWQNRAEAAEARVEELEAAWVKVRGQVPQYAEAPLTSEGLLHGIRQLASLYDGERILRERDKKRVEELERVLGDLVERANRARAILKAAGNWGMLDTTEAVAALARREAALEGK